MADCIDQINEQFWLEMTKESTLPYCHEMLKLSLDFQCKRQIDTPYEEYLCSLDNKIHAYMDLINEYNHQGKWDNIIADQSPFPKDLHGYIHEYEDGNGRFQPNHLMCKLAVLRSNVKKINYELGCKV